MDFIERMDTITNIVKASLSIAKSDGNPITVITELREHLQSLREDVLDAKDEALGMRAELLKLREQLSANQDFDANKGRYFLKQFQNGALAYALKLGEEGLESTYYLCAHCFDEKRHTKLQVKRMALGKDTYACPACQTEVLIPNVRKMNTNQMAR